MLNTTINILSYRLHVRISKKRGSPRSASIFPDMSIIQKVRTGSKISRYLRHLIERVNFKAMLGGNLAFFVVLTGVATPGSFTQTGRVLPETIILASIDQPLTTEIAIQYPLEKVKINQAYHLFHPGIDLEGVTGDHVRPVMKGRVVHTEKSRFAYGNSVIVDHQNGYQSLYAHLSKIAVTSGQDVETKTVLGNVGATGRATGDHLHLEVYQNGRTVNPLSVLPR